MERSTTKIFKNYFESFKNFLVFKKTRVLRLLTIAAILASVPTSLYLATRTINFRKSQAAQDTPDAENVRLNQLRQDLGEDSNKILKLNIDLKGARENEKEVKKKEIMDLSIKRKGKAKEIISKDPKSFLLMAIPEKVKKAMPVEVRANLESEVSLQGELKVFHGDNFDKKISKSEYLINNATGRNFVYFADGGPENLPSGSKVEIKGFKIDDKIAVESSENISQNKSFKILYSPSTVGGGDSPSTVGGVAGTTKNVAVLLINFPNNKVEPWTKEEVNNWTFSDPDSVSSYYKEVSFEKLILTGGVFGWFTVPENSDPCDPWAWSISAKRLASEAGINLDVYNHFVYAFPNTLACWFAGLANINGPDSWINGYYAGSKHGIVVHELGHNLGALHASSYYCTDESGNQVSISSNCRIDEYGDPFDVMGGAWDGRHMNNFHKGQLGWLDPVNTLNVSLKTGTQSFTISPIELPAKKTLSLRIPRTKNSSGQVTEYYYVEYRKPFGLFDNFLRSATVTKGVTLRIAPGYNAPWEFDLRSRLIDAIPDSNYDYINSALTSGKVFTDQSRGISIKTLPFVSSANQIRVEVNYSTPKCVRAKPDLGLYPIAQWGFPGESLYYFLKVRNNDSYSCGGSTFVLEPTLFTDWSYSPKPLSIAVSPEGQSGYSLFSVSSSLGTPEGYYTFSLTETHAKDARLNSSINANYNVYPSDNVPPTVKIIEPTEGLMLTGSVMIKSDASDNFQVEYVDYYLDRMYLGSAYPIGINNYEFLWDTKSTGDGAHTLSAIAIDRAGNKSEEYKVNIAVSNKQTPTPTPTPRTPPPPSLTPSPRSSPTPTPRTPSPRPTATP